MNFGLNFLQYTTNIFCIRKIDFWKPSTWENPFTLDSQRVKTWVIPVEVYTGASRFVVLWGQKCVLLQDNEAVIVEVLSCYTPFIIFLVIIVAFFSNSPKLYITLLLMMIPNFYIYIYTSRINLRGSSDKFPKYSDMLLY